MLASLLFALLLVIVGGIAFVLDGSPAETVAPEEHDSRPRTPRHTAEATVERGEPGAAFRATPARAAGAADEPRARTEDDWTPPLPMDLLSDPMREAKGSSGARPMIRGRAGGTIGVRSALPRIQAEGVVVDARTGASIATARLTVFIPKREDLPWGYPIRGAESGEDGSFTLKTRSVGEEQRRAAELAVSAAGYHSWRGPLDRAELRVELQPVRLGELSGTISGRATDDRGRRLYGPLLISLRSEFGVAESQWVLAGTDGRFELRGVSRGRWWVRVADRAAQEWTDVQVAAGTEASVELRGVLLREPPASGGFGPRRKVVVRALPEGVDERAVVRAENGNGLFWRTTVLNREARFELPRGGWTIVAESPPGTELRRFVTVASGDGPQIVELTE